MKALFTAIFCCLLIFPSFGQKDSTAISLLTYSPLPPIYGAFGHSAIRVQDFKQQTDVIYNYGIFDFDEPNFVWKFLRGKLEYQLGKESTKRVFNYYSAKGERQVWDQELILDEEEKKAIVAYLENNYLPENRKYYYDFFFDNCATRIRDIMEIVLEGELQYKADVKTDLTLRQLLDVHIESRPWDDFGMDLLVGIPADRQATFREQMFLPGYLSQNLTEGLDIVRTSSDSAKTITTLPLLGEKRLVVDGDNYMNEPGWFTPFVVFGLLCLLMLILTLRYTHNKLLAILDGMLFFALGFTGLFLLFMWLGTHHAATQWNLNILWANPLYFFLFIPILLRKQKWMKIGYGMALTTSIIILLGWGVFPQQLHTGVLPIILMMLVRSGSAFLYLRKNKA